MSETVKCYSEMEELMEFEIDDMGEEALVIEDVMSLSSQALDQSSRADEAAPVVLVAEHLVPPAQLKRLSGKFTRRPDEAAEEDILKQYLDEIGQHPLLTKVDEQILGQSIMDGRIALGRLSSGEPLDKEERDEFETIAASGRQAYKKFVNSNLRLVVSIAKNYTSSGVPLLDLIQDGNLGLMHAVDKFDHRKGFKFSTYGTWWIRQAITRGIASTGRTIRLSIHLNDTILAVRKARWILAQEHGREPTTEEIAADINSTPDHVETALSHSDPVFSYNDTVKDGEDMEFIEYIQDEQTPQPSEVAMTNALKEQVNRALDNLTPREANAIRLRFGLDGGGQRSAIEVGNLIGLGREAARKEIKVAMAKLRMPSIKSQLKDATEN